MTSIDILPGLAPLAPRYDAIICDVWGVLHNGVIGYHAAGDALAAFRAAGKPVLLLTNAPRPAWEVERMLLGFGIRRDAWDEIVTSGDVCSGLLEAEGDRRAWHLGPERDAKLFDGLALRLADEATAEVIVCTGLFDDDVETAEDYRQRLAPLAARGLTFYCANPDIVVERGDRLIYCAGALAQLYAELGGPVVIVGKPHKPVYEASFQRLQAIGGRAYTASEVLAIGDALPTDVRGGWGQGMDVLLVTAGIHAADFGPVETPDADRITRRLAIEGVEVVAAVPRLRW